MSSMALSLVCAVVLAMACTSLAQPQDYVAAHNTSRALVGVGPVSWSSTMATSAQNYANQRVDDCALTPSGSSYGENFFWSSDAGATAEDAVASWVSEEPYYDYNTNQCQSGQVCTHYTQVVWSASTTIGCGSVACNDDAGVLFICYYYPAGNIVGERPY